VTATLLQTTNTYLVGSPDRATLTIANSDQPVFTTVISNLHLPVGIDYHSPSNLLIVSLNFNTGLLEPAAKVPFSCGARMPTSANCAQNSQRRPRR